MTLEGDPHRRPGEVEPGTPLDQEALEPAPVEREGRFDTPSEMAREPHERPQGMIPGRERRRTKVERGFMRLIATGGIVGVATALGAILVSQDVAGWIIGLVIGLVSVILAALLWSSRQL
ncbi:hypothetical protein [Capillimicrobium parvum]|uniref:Uncharacterized protein n=1 Tax=Capillimicrobium parvum TaxID=2884022 RepID=A0A9E6Y0L7_9ACTN|nr:hypothetical protein [Capillimicrobium parvum]UGS37578.1 hypothetical protein DSM104329_03995 [Capillimicrobium parvum]